MKRVMVAFAAAVLMIGNALAIQPEDMPFDRSNPREEIIGLHRGVEMIRYCNLLITSDVVEAWDAFLVEALRIVRTENLMTEAEIADAREEGIAQERAKDYQNYNLVEQAGFCMGVAMQMEMLFVRH